MKPTKLKPERKKQNLSQNSSANYKIIPTDIFIAEAKKLAKKYPNIKNDFFQTMACYYLTLACLGK